VKAEPAGLARDFEEKRSRPVGEEVPASGATDPTETAMEEHIGDDEGEDAMDEDMAAIQEDESEEEIGIIRQVIPSRAQGRIQSPRIRSVLPASGYTRNHARKISQSGTRIRS
jgi:hypothetical protein